MIALVTVAFFSFVLSGMTVSTAPEQMMSYFPWRGANVDFTGMRNGYPQTDFADSFFPHWRFLASELRQGRLPLWYPFDFSGTRSPETGLFGFYYPPRIILSFLFGAIGAHSGMMMLHSFLAMAFSFRLLRWLGCSSAASFTGALIWALNGHNIFHISFEYAVIIATWVPLALWAAGRAVQERSWAWAIASGAATGLTWFGGYANYSYAFGLVTGAWWLYLLVPVAKEALSDGSIRRLAYSIGLVCTAVVAALLTGAAFWLPFIDVVQTAVRVPATLQDQLKKIIDPLQVARGMLWPESMSGPVWGYDAGSLVFAGVPALFLLPFALLAGSRFRWFFLGLGAIALAFLTGFRPLFLLGHAILPMFGAIHPSSIGAQLFMLPVAVSAAYGLDGLIHALSRFGVGATVKSFAAGSIVVLTGASLLLLFRASQPLVPASPTLGFPATPLTEKFSALEAANRTKLAPAQDLSGALSFPIFFGGSHGSVGIRSVFGYDSIVQPENYWVTQAIASGGNLPPVLTNPDSAALGHVAVSAVPVALLSRISAGLIATTPGAGPPTQDGASLQKREELDEVYTGPDGILWRSRSALSRAFLASEALVVPWGEPALRMLVREDYNPKLRVMVHPQGETEEADVAKLASGGAVAGDVTFVKDEANEVRLSVRASRPALVVLNDTWAPGWRATVNGTASSVLRANYAYRAVVVPAGDSQVAFIYRPWPLLIGLVLSVASLTVLTLFALCRLLAQPRAFSGAPGRCSIGAPGSERLQAPVARLVRCR